MSSAARYSLLAARHSLCAVDSHNQGLITYLNLFKRKEHGGRKVAQRVSSLLITHYSLLSVTAIGLSVGGCRLGSL